MSLPPRLARLLPDPGPARPLALATLVNTVGNGMFFTSSAIFFTRSVGLSAAQVGFGLTLAAALGLLAGVPMGHLADRRGPREVLLALLVLEGIATTLYALAHSFASFLIIVSLVTIVDRGSNAVRSAVIAGVASGGNRVRTRAYLRSVTNVGISAGTVAAGFALHADTRGAYLALIFADAVTFWLAAVAAVRVPHVPPTRRAQGESRLMALRDRPYLAVTALNGLLAVHYGMLEIAVPLWIVTRTEAPRWTVALVFLVNTVSVVLFQVRASRGTENLDAAARASRRSGVLLAGSCLLFAAAAGRSSAVAVAVLVVAALVQVGGELLQAAGSWGLGFGLAPDHRQGQYQGVFSTGFSVSAMLAPVVVVTLTISVGPLGWAVLGALFLAVGAAMVPVAGWAAANRPAPTAPPEPPPPVPSPVLW